MNKATILIVEDGDEFRKIYGDRLRFGGYDVLDAADGKAALEVLAKEKVDLVMTDINMPKMNGYELIAAIRAQDSFKTLPIVVMSVFDQGDHLKKALEAGANEYFIKGQVTPNGIKEKIDRLLVK